jgi:hypothetical protein
MISEERVKKANDLIAAIAGCGRKFFCYKDALARLEQDERGRVWFVNEFNNERVFTHYDGEWKKFAHGGTLRSLIKDLRDYITSGKQINPSVFGPWPSWYCDGDLWGYGKDMDTVRSAAISLGIIKDIHVLVEANR